MFSLSRFLSMQLDVSNTVQELLTTQMFTGIHYVHYHLIMHRDLKPANMLVHFSPTGQLQLCLADFGASTIVQAQFKDAAKMPLKLSRLVTTYPYVAPECADRRLYYFASDVWSIGITIVEMCLNEPVVVFDHGNTKAAPGGFNKRLLAAITTALEGLPRRLEKNAFKTSPTVLQLLQVQPESRPTASTLFQVAQAFQSENLNQEKPIVSNLLEPFNPMQPVSNHKKPISKRFSKKSKPPVGSEKAIVNLRSTNSEGTGEAEPSSHNAAVIDQETFTWIVEVNISSARNWMRVSNILADRASKQFGKKCPFSSAETKEQLGQIVFQWRSAASKKAVDSFIRDWLVGNGVQLGSWRIRKASES